MRGLRFEVVKHIQIYWTLVTLYIFLPILWQLRWPSTASNLCQKGLEGPPANTTIAALLIHPHVVGLIWFNHIPLSTESTHAHLQHIPIIISPLRVTSPSVLCFNLQELQQTGAPHFVRNWQNCRGFDKASFWRVWAMSSMLARIWLNLYQHIINYHKISWNIIKYHTSSVTILYALSLFGFLKQDSMGLESFLQICTKSWWRFPLTAPQKHLRNPNYLHMILSDLTDAVHWVWDCRVPSRRRRKNLWS